MSRLLDEIWYENHPLKYPLVPLSLIYWTVASVSKSINRLRSTRASLDVPVIVVGNNRINQPVNGSCF